MTVYYEYDAVIQEAIGIQVIALGHWKLEILGTFRLL